MQSPSKPTAPDPSGPQGWADLPEGLLHSIIPLLGSFLDLLAFAGSCSSWHAAFASYPHKSTFRTLLPPLLVRPNVRVRAPHLPSSHDGHKLRTCQVIDPANPNTALCCQIPQETLQKKHFAGFSYGQLICGRRRDCLIVDVFTGARVSPPHLPFSEDTFFYCGMLTAPLTSPNSHLLICSQSNGSPYSCQYSLFDWLVGSDSWSELRLDDARIDQVVDFNGQLIAMDYHQRLYTVSLAPNLGLQEIATLWWDGMSECPCLRPWLVVCGDMLLIVDHYISFSLGAPVVYKAYSLNMLTNPATWVEVEKLENYTLFVGADVRALRFLALALDDGEGGATVYIMHMTFNLGACMGWGMRQMLCGMAPMTLNLCLKGTGMANFSRSGCTQACSTMMVSDLCHLQPAVPHAPSYSDKVLPSLREHVLSFAFKYLRGQRLLQSSWKPLSACSSYMLVELIRT